MEPAPDGAGFACSTCHTTRDHAIAGSRYAGSPGDSPKRPALAGAAASCQACHSASPHKELASGRRLDRHIDRVACETCHIPLMARGETGTRILWDWSTAGELGRDHRPMVEKDGAGHIIYSTEKGSLAAAGGLRPSLVWSDGRLATRRPGDVLAAQTALKPEAASTSAPRQGQSLDAIEADFADAPWIAAYQGDAADAGSRIVPVKVMHSVVPIDAGSGGLAAVKLAGRGGDALWNRFDWPAAARTGMAAASVPFSGEVAFARVGR